MTDWSHTPSTPLTDEQWEAQLSHQRLVRQAELEAETEQIRMREDEETRRVLSRHRLLKSIIVGILTTLGILASLTAGALVIENDMKKDTEMIQLCAQKGMGWESSRSGYECTNR